MNLILTIDPLMLLHHSSHEIMMQFLSILPLLLALFCLQMLLHCLRLYVAGLSAVRYVAQVHRRRRYRLVLHACVHCLE